MLDRRFFLALLFSLILEVVVHESLINGQISHENDHEMDQKWVSKPDIMAIKNILEDKGYVLIPGRIMKELLTQYGATEEDFRVLESGHIHRYLPPDQQPVMRHRLVNIVSDSILKLCNIISSIIKSFSRTRVTEFYSTQRTSQSSPRTPTP